MKNISIRVSQELSDEKLLRGYVYKRRWLLSNNYAVI